MQNFQYRSTNTTQRWAHIAEENPRCKLILTDYPSDYLSDYPRVIGPSAHMGTRVELAVGDGVGSRHGPRQW